MEITDEQVVEYLTKQNKNGLMYYRGITDALMMVKDNESKSKLKLRSQGENYE